MNLTKKKKKKLEICCITEFKNLVKLAFDKTMQCIFFFEILTVDFNIGI